MSDVRGHDCKTEQAFYPSGVSMVPGYNQYEYDHTDYAHTILLNNYSENPFVPAFTNKLGRLPERRLPNSI